MRSIGYIPVFITWLLIGIILVVTAGCGHTLSGLGQDAYNLGQALTPADQRDNVNISH